MRKTHILFAVLAAFTLPLTACNDPSAWRESLPFQWYEASSTSMEPNYSVGTQIFAVSVDPTELARGDVVIAKSQAGEDYIVRVIGLPGDRIGVEDGVIILNGERVEQKLLGDYSYETTYTYDQPYTVTLDARRLREGLPGASGSHEILDSGESPADNYPIIELIEGEYFLMGDNRDHAADSRVLPEFNGLGVLTADRIKRRVR